MLKHRNTRKRHILNILFNSPKCAGLHLVTKMILPLHNMSEKGSIQRKQFITSTVSRPQGKTGECDHLPIHRGTPLLHGSVRMDSRKALCHHSKSDRQCAHVARSASHECRGQCSVVPSVQRQAQRSPLGSH